MERTGRSVEEKKEEFEAIICKLKNREDELKARLYKGGSDLEFELPVSIAGLRILRSAFETALWAVNNPEGEWNSSVFETRDTLSAFGKELKDIIEPVMDGRPIDRGIDYLLGTYLRAFNDAHNELKKCTDRHLEKLMKKVGTEFPPDPKKKGTAYFRERKAVKE